MLLEEKPSQIYFSPVQWKKQNGKMMRNFGTCNWCYYIEPITIASEHLELTMVRNSFRIPSSARVQDVKRKVKYNTKRLRF